MFEKGHAIIIGVGGDLQHTKKEAEVIAGVLCSPMCGYPQNQVHLLTEERATKSEILNAFRIVRNKTGNTTGATIFFYFSGHGKRAISNDSSPNYYLLPWGYNVSNLEETAISGDYLAKCFKLIGNAQKICLIFDCCHAGGFTTFKSTDSLSLKPYPIPFSYAKELSQGSGRVIVASSRADEVSVVGELYSVFTEAILEAFSHQKLAQYDEFVRVLDVFAYVSRVVPLRTGGSQNPILHATDLQDNFALAIRGNLQAVVQSAPEAELGTWKRMLDNHKLSLLLIEQRMSEYVMTSDIPLQYRREKDIKLQTITELEKKLDKAQP